MESICKVELIGLAYGLNDILSPLHPPALVCNYEMYSDALDLTVCLALSNRMKQKCKYGASKSTTQEALLFLVFLSSP